MSDPRKLRDRRKRMADVEAVLKEMRDFANRDGECEAVPFISRATLCDAVLAIKNCQEGDDDLLCVKCCATLDRIAATARLALSDKRRTSAHVWNMPDVSGFPTDGSERDA